MLTLIFTPFVMGALSAKTRLKTVWGQVNSSLAFAFAGLLLTEWGTRERISLRFTSVDRTKLVSLRSPLPTADLPAWLMAQGAGQVSSNLAMQSAAATALGITRAG